jgi:two-component system chemotaxis sensor kinase CheA
VNTEELKRSLLTKFVEVTHDRLQAIQLGILELEKPEGARAGDGIARELHTMKGEARMLGLAAVGQIAHCCEDLLKSRLEKKVESRVATDLFLQACDVIADLLEDYQAAKEGSSESNEMAERLATTAGSSVPSLKPRTPGPTAPSARKKERQAPPPPSAPPVPGVIVPPLSASQPSSPSAETRADRSPADRSIRVNVETLDALGLLAGDLLVESARAGLRSEEVQGLFLRFSRVGDHLIKLLEQQPLQPDQKKLAAGFEGDLHLLRDDAFRFVRAHSDGLNTLHGNLSQLADHVGEARLVPLASVFDAFPRAARELAHEQNKSIEMIVENTSAGVDRSLVADLRDALVHLMRNAVDHGIESPEARSTLGKPETGKLVLRARANGDMLHVDVEDDGRGMDPLRLREVAVRKRLLTEAQAAALTEREAMELIFRPGFSTREEVSETSGRGVGMDVVKRKVESLGGFVGISSRPGLGTVVSLRLPQSLALMRVLLIRLGDDVYGMPAADVEAVARFRPEDRLEIMGTLAVMHRGRPVNLAALGPLLGLNGGPRFERAPCVVVRHGEDRAALVVDGFVDEREVAVKPVGGEFFKGVPFVAGSAALEDGRIAVLLHVPDIMAEVRKLARPVAETAQTRRLRVLLVDDSPIARATESALVRALGHAVEEAQDGEDGWNRIRTEKFDLIITDLQMPRLDGFGLARRIKQSAEFSKIPVIILSSLASPEDKRRGLDSGADAYFVKGELGVESLSLTIDRLT